MFLCQKIAKNDIVLTLVKSDNHFVCMLTTCNNAWYHWVSPVSEPLVIFYRTWPIRNLHNSVYTLHDGTVFTTYDFLSVAQRSQYVCVHTHTAALPETKFKKSMSDKKYISLRTDLLITFHCTCAAAYDLQSSCLRLVSEPPVIFYRTWPVRSPRNCIHTLYDGPQGLYLRHTTFLAKGCTRHTSIWH